MATQAIQGQPITWPSAVKIGITAVFLAMAVCTWRPWCGVLCPLGAIYGLLNHVSLFYVRFNPEECNDCELCRKMCRYRGRGERRGAQGRCVRCLECSGCDAITIGTAFGKSPEP
jgi:polyferredoxin